MAAQSCAWLEREERVYAGILESGLRLDSMQSPQSFLTYESDILYSLRFMVDCNVTGGQWVTLPAAGYQVQPKHARLTHCQHELHAHYSKLISHPSDGQPPAHPGSYSCYLLSAPPLLLPYSQRPCARAFRRCCPCSEVHQSPWAEVCNTDIEDINTAYCRFCVISFGGVTMCCPDAGKWLKLAPLRILSMDIECAGRKVSVANDKGLHEMEASPQLVSSDDA